MTADQCLPVCNELQPSKTGLVVYTLINFCYNDLPFPHPLSFLKEDRNKTIHSERLCQRKPFDGNYLHSFNDLFLRV